MIVKCIHLYYSPWPILLRAKCLSTFNSPVAKIHDEDYFHKIILDREIQLILTKSSADGEGLHDMPQIQNIAFEK